MAKVNAVPFHEKEYWKNRFEKEKHFEWLVTWDDIKEEFEPYLDRAEDVLHLGCGNSELAFDLADSGYKTIVNVDYAENVIEYMKSVTHEKQQQNSNYSNISWISGDCLNNLKSYLPKDQYLIIIDKSLVDTIACGDDDHQSRVKQLSREMLSVAKPNAYWLSISFSGEREFYIDNQEQFYWKTEQRIPIQVPQPNDKPGAPAIYYYLYINHKMSA